MSHIISVSPFRCRIWTEHDRLEEYITEKSCKTEIDSFSAHGQLLPVLGRPVRDDPMYEVEVICGARRVYVARHLNVPLSVDLRDISDREAIVALDIENRHRKDISPYERGLSYKRWLQGQHFRCQDDLARATGVSASQVSRLLKLSQLPTVVVSAFQSPLDIRETWGLELYEMWQDPQRRRRLAEKARIIASQTHRPRATKVYETLLGGPGHRHKHERAARSRDEIVTSENGTPLFRIRYQRKAVALLLPCKHVSAQSMDQIKFLLADILQHASPQVPVSLNGFLHKPDGAVLDESDRGHTGRSPQNGIHASNVAELS